MSEIHYRLSARSLLARYLDASLSLLGLGVGIVVYFHIPDLLLGVWGLWILITLVVLQVSGIVLSWLTTRYVVSPEKLVFKRLGPFPSQNSIRWNQVVVADIEEPWAYRLFGLGTVSLRTGGQDDTKIDLYGIPTNQIEEFTQRTATAPAHIELVETVLVPTEPEAGPETSADESSVFFRATMKDLLVTSLIYGQVLVLGIGAVYGMYEFVEQFGLGDDFFDLDPVLIVIVAIVAVLLLGMITTVLRYGRFALAHQEQSVVITWGVLTTHRREIDRKHVVGIRIHRNLVEMLTDRVRVSLLTTDTTAHMGANMLLPSLPRRTALAILTPYWPHLYDMTTLSKPGRASIGRSLV